MKGKRRAVEWGKNLLIFFLTLSAVYLLTLTPLMSGSGLLGLLIPSETAASPSSVTLGTASRPVRMAVYRDGERYAMQYRQDTVDQMFVHFSPLLGEALVSAGQPRDIAEEQWQGLLSGLSVYFDFSGHIDLSVLAGWMRQDGGCALSASARRILLAAGEGDGVLLCYQDGETGGFHACDTGLTQTLHLRPASEDFEGNGALFAFESDDLRELLAPYTLVVETETSRTVYTASTPLTSASDVSWLLTALSYSGQNHTSVRGGEVYLDGGDRLLVGSDGTVTYRAVGRGKYPVPGAGENVAMAEAIEAARKLAESTVGAQCGEAQLYLISALEQDGGWLIRFGYQLNGSTVWLYDDGWAAEFFVREGYVTEFALRFRSYTAGGQQPLLPVDKAAAMLPDLTDEQRELVIQYRDWGDSSVLPVWVAE